MHIGATLCRLVQCGADWCSWLNVGLLHIGTDWCSLVQHGADGGTWYSLEQLGAAPWCRLVQFGGTWCRLVQSHTAWCSLLQFVC